MDCSQSAAVHSRGTRGGLFQPGQDASGSNLGSVPYLPTKICPRAVQKSWFLPTFPPFFLPPFTGFRLMHHPKALLSTLALTLILHRCPPVSPSRSNSIWHQHPENGTDTTGRSQAEKAAGDEIFGLNHLPFIYRRRMRPPRGLWGMDSPWHKGWWASG